MAELDWETRLQRTRAEAGAFAPFLGSWRGTGAAHGAATTGELVGEALLDGSFVEVRERSPEHEDRSIYRWEAEDGSLRVMHLMAGATLREYPVERTGTGLVWVTPPGEPAVEWRFAPDELVCEVTWPGEAGPEVQMVWRRVAEAGA